MPQPERRERPQRYDSLGATKSNAANVSQIKTITDATDHLAHFQRRVLIEAMLDGWGATWERRARALEAARPRPGDFHGQASREELQERWQRLTDAAAACRANATIAPLELAAEAVDTVLREAS